MRKYSVILLALLMVFAIHSGVYADDDDHFAIDGFKIDEDGAMWYKPLTSFTSTNDTVTTSESGTVFFATTGGAYKSIEKTLPAVEDNLTYTFIQQGTGTLIELIPDGTDYFLYSTAGASDHIRGPATAGASVTIWSSDDTVWFVETNGTFSVVPF